jgi:hypothetical protein
MDCAVSWWADSSTDAIPVSDQFKTYRYVATPNHASVDPSVNLNRILYCCSRNLMLNKIPFVPASLITTLGLKPVVKDECQANRFLSKTRNRYGRTQGLLLSTADWPGWHVRMRQSGAWHDLHCILESSPTSPSTANQAGNKKNP